MKGKGTFQIILKAINDQYTMQVLLPMQKEEEFRVMAYYDIGKTACAKMLKNERVQVVEQTR